MDAHTLDLLEFGKIREIVAGCAGSAAGKRRALAMVPMSDRAAIEEAVGLTTEAADALAVRLEPPVGGLRDVEQTVRRASLGVLLEVEQIVDLRDVFTLTTRVVEFGRKLGGDYPRLGRLVSGIRDEGKLVQEIDRVIDERSRVVDSASPELRDIRRQLAVFEERIQEELRRLLRSEDIRKALRYPQATMSGGHHVLPVAVNHRQKVQGVVHRTSATGETVYVEPTRVAAISAETSVLKSAEDREIRRILRRLSDMIRKEAPTILATLESLSLLDFTVAKAKFSLDYRMNPAELTGGSPDHHGVLYFPEARHPLLEQLARQRSTEEEPKSVVPVTIRLGAEYDLLIITGPNTGGKTVALKTVGLLSAMALAGMHVPAGRGCQVALLDDILADIGDEQSLEQSLSTFSSHITRVAKILEHCGPKTLVLLDEVGAGTEPSEGAALGRAILDELRERGCRAMVTTHLNDLKTYAFSATRTENAAMEFDSESLRPTYRLVVGQIGQSCALKIARRLKLPSELLKRAKRYLHRRRIRSASELTKLQEMRQEAEVARNEALVALTEAERLKDEFRLKTENLKQEATVTAELEKARQTLRPGDQVRVAKFSKSGTVNRVDIRKRTAAVTVGAVEWQLSLDEIIPMAAT
jgi:DNA mismatch repair protein MutS2